MAVTYRSFDVEVEGGTIAVGQWGEGDRIVLASHGITSNHRSFQRIAELIVDQSKDAFTVVAVDHRGRASSAGSPGPFGLATHANDLIAVLDHFDCPSAVLIGHSMGGFVVSVAAERHPERVERLILIDGGLPFPLDVPDDAGLEDVVQSVIGPALDRLDQRWPDEASYVEFFKGHPAFRPPNEWPAAVEAYVRHDATITDSGEIRSSVSKDAVLVDGGAAIVDPHSSSAIRRVSTPTTLLWAPRGVLDQTPGLYTADQIESDVSELEHVETKLVEGTNHYTIACGEQGATAVSAVLLACFEPGPRPRTRPGSHD